MRTSYRMSIYIQNPLSHRIIHASSTAQHTQLGGTRTDRYRGVMKSVYLSLIAGKRSVVQRSVHSSVTSSMCSVICRASLSLYLYFSPPRTLLSLLLGRMWRTAIVRASIVTISSYRARVQASMPKECRYSNTSRSAQSVDAPGLYLCSLSALLVDQTFLNGAMKRGETIEQGYKIRTTFARSIGVNIC